MHLHPAIPAIQMLSNHEGRHAPRVVTGAQAAKAARFGLKALVPDMVGSRL